MDVILIYIAFIGEKAIINSQLYFKTIKHIKSGALFVNKKILATLLSTSILGTSLLGVAPVQADGYDQQIEEAQREANENGQAAESLNALMNELTSEVTNTQAALDNLNSQISRNEAYLQDAVRELEAANKEMNQLLDEIAVLEENIEKRSEKLDEQARLIQTSGNSADYFEYIINADSLTEIIGRIDIVSNIINSSNSMMEAQISDKEAVSEKSEETERKIAQQNAIAEELEKTSADLEGQKISQEALVAQLQYEQSNVASEREELLAQRDSALARVSTINNEREAVQVAAQEAQAEQEEQEQVEEITVATSTRSSNLTSRSSNNGNSNSSSSNSGSSNNSGGSNNSSGGSSNNTGGNSNSGGNNSGGGSSTPAPKPPTPAPSGNVISIANQYLGTPYKWGGTTPSGFDCSGFTQYVFRQAGKTIPRDSRAQYAQSTKISNPQPGDLVFFGSGSVTHVGIYTGGGQFVGSQTSTGVAYTSVHGSYWGPLFIGYGRY